MKMYQWMCASALGGVLSLTASATVTLYQPGDYRMPEYAPVADASATGSADEEKLYAQATQAINESRWSDAEPLLSQVIELHGRRAEGALYWKAYVESKQGRTSEVASTCASLREANAQSKWMKDCNALQIEVGGKNGQPVQPQNESDEDLKLLALNALMQNGDENALPILQQILEGNQSEKLKERALFVLAQDQSKQAQDIMAQIVRGQKDPKLQVRAIRLLSVARGKESGDLLADVYSKSSDPQVKRAVIDSYLVSNQPDKLIQVAQHESDPELARHAVSELGAMGAVPQLGAMYQSAPNKETKLAVIHALVASGNKGSDLLKQIASSEQDPELRTQAIRNLGIAGGSSAAPTLVAIYQKSSDEESKKAAANGLFISGDAHDLVQLARSEKDPSLKRELVGKLAVMHNKEATDYMMEILNK
ncbi:HEAT repeat domain-containing protein [Acidicapsa dinghuensis]|uniref:HEAT repeat domain-containing protein n=1 Tax=Acidicapsa dinghuensis TaxID=2218256 RepID=A0ABW1EKG6_9BACT|nr:HEAT repeat domain-containing protein [Acidicapsa dinghuensis]